jgi:hypothetical protein
MEKSLETVKLKLRTSRLLSIFANLLILSIPSRTFWTWDLYGLGNSLKDVQGIAKRKKIRTSSDHGLSIYVHPLPDEVAIPADTHVTWSQWRTSLKFPDSRKVIRIKHPWIEYRKKHSYVLSGNAMGTLVFVPHSVPGDHTNLDVKHYVNLMSTLPSIFHPLVFCLHAHDVNVKTIRAIHNEGFSAVTVGNSLHPRYVRRFYRLLKDFEFASSSTIGSQLFYAHEFGVKYFLHDPENRFQRVSNYELSLETDNEIVYRVEKAFGIDNVFDRSVEKDSIVSEALGLDCITLNARDYI